MLREAVEHLPNLDRTITALEEALYALQRECDALQMSDGVMVEAARLSLWLSETTLVARGAHKAYEAYASRCLDSVARLAGWSVGSASLELECLNEAIISVVVATPSQTVQAQSTNNLVEEYHALTAHWQTGTAVEQLELAAQTILERDDRLRTHLLTLGERFRILCEMLEREHGNLAQYVVESVRPESIKWARTVPCTGQSALASMY
jgi:hypothetical protein